MTAVRSKAALALTALGLAAAALAPAGATAQAGARPNIVFVMTDDQTRESLRVMSKLRAGAIDQGTQFTRSVAVYPLCCPSRATYLTGQYPHNHGVIHNAGPFGGYTRLDNTNTLPVWLQNAGYRTMNVGRYLNGYGTQNPDITEIPPGWTDWYATLDPSTFHYTRWRMNENGRIIEKPGPDSPGEHQTDYLGRRATQLIQRAAPSSRPFFLSLTFPAPHSGLPADPDDPPDLGTPSPAPRHRNAFSTTPLPRPPSFDEASVFDKPQITADRRRLTLSDVAAIQENYQQELESLLSVDDAMGSVLDALRRSGELENTLFIYTSDNGFFHGEHRYRGEKVLPYWPAANVPLVMRGPGVPRGKTLRQLVANVDLAPTILEAAQATPRRLQDGRSLMSVLRDQTLELGREFVHENGAGVNGVPRYRALRNDRFLFVRHDSTGETELYDLRKDPYELTSRDESDSYAGVIRVLARRLRLLQRCAGRACQVPRPSVRVALREVQPKPKRKETAERSQTCVARDVRLALSGRDGKRVESVRYTLGRRRLGTSRKRPFRVTVKRRRLPAGRLLAIRARVTARDGRVVTLDRGVATCPR